MQILWPEPNHNIAWTWPPCNFNYWMLGDNLKALQSHLLNFNYRQVKIHKKKCWIMTKSWIKIGPNIDKIWPKYGRHNWLYFTRYCSVGLSWLFSQNFKTVQTSRNKDTVEIVKYGSYIHGPYLISRLDLMGDGPATVLIKIWTSLDK